MCGKLRLSFIQKWSVVDVHCWILYAVPQERNLRKGGDCDKRDPKNNEDSPDLRCGYMSLKKIPTPEVWRIFVILGILGNNQANKMAIVELECNPSTQQSACVDHLQADSAAAHFRSLKR